MSDDSLAKAEPRELRPKGWGVIAGTFWAAIVFLLPQIIVGMLLPLFGAVFANENVRMFAVQVFAHLLTVGGLWLVLRGYKMQFADLGLVKTKAYNIVLAVVIFPVYMVTSVLLTNVTARIYPVNLDQEQLIGFVSPSVWELALVFVALVVVTPMVEELVFRGFLWRAYHRRFGFWPAAILVSLLFAVAHGQMNVALDVFALSLFLCYLRAKTQSLWPAIALHATKNFVAFVVLFIIGVK